LHKKYKLFPIIFLLLIPLTLLNTIDFTWDAGGDGVTWSDGDNWNIGPFQYPDGANDTATINIPANINMDVANLTIGEVNINNAFATVTANGNITVDDTGGESGDLNITNGILNIQGNSLNLDHDLNGGGTLTSTGGNINIENNWAFTGTFNHGNNTVTFDGTGGSITATTFYNLTINSGGNIWNTTGALTTDNDLNIQAGELNIQGNLLNIDHDITITGTLTSTGGNITVEEDWNRTGTFTHGGNTVTFNGAGGTISGTTFNTLIINNAGSTWTSGGNITCNSNLTITNGALDIAATTLSVAGIYNNLDILRRNAAATAPQDNNSGRVVYYGGGGNIQDYGGGNDYYDLEIVSGAHSLTASLGINRDLIITGGSLSTGANNLTVGDDVTGAGTLTGGAGSIDINDTLSITTMTGSSTQTNVGGNYNVANYNHNGGLLVFDTSAGSTVTSTGDNLGNIRFTVNKTLNDNLTCIDLNISGGTLNGTNRTINLTGDWDNTGGGFTSTNSTVNFNGTGDQQIRSNGQNFNIVTIANTGARNIVLMDDLGINNDFTFNNGTLDLSANNINVGNDFNFYRGTLDTNGGGDITTGNNFNIRGGLFTDTNGGSGMYNATTITVGNIFEAIAVNSNIEFRGRGPAANRWILNINPIPATNYGRVESGAGGIVSSSYSDASGGKEVGCALAEWPTYPPTTIISCINWNDILGPYITKRRARLGAYNNSIYVEFNENVYDENTGGIVASTNIQFNDTLGDGPNLNNITSYNGSNSKYYFEFDNPYTISDIDQDTMQAIGVNPNRIRDGAGNFMDSTKIYSMSSIGIEFFINVTVRNIISNDDDDWHIVDELDGTATIRSENLIVRAQINPYFSGNTPVLYYYLTDTEDDAKFWMPTSRTSSVRGINRSNNYWEFIITDAGEYFQSGLILSFIFETDGWYCYRGIYPANHPKFFEAETYMVQIKNLWQNNNVTILNNVIDPRNGEKTRLLYLLEKSGPVSIVVYDLKSDVVKVLEQENKSSGMHSVTWDGKNNNGKIVARGVYFIRIRAPGIFNQIRKVLIIK